MCSSIALKKTWKRNLEVKKSTWKLLGIERLDSFAGKDFSELLQVPLNNAALDDSGNKIGLHHFPFFQTGLSD